MQCRFVVTEPEESRSRQVDDPDGVWGGRPSLPGRVATLCGWPTNPVETIGRIVYLLGASELLQVLELEFPLNRYRAVPRLSSGEVSG